MSGMDELSYLRYAALPDVGARYLWMPHAEHASETVIVLSVTWTGQAFWIESLGEESGKTYPNELDRWIEATVLMSPPPESGE